MNWIFRYQVRLFIVSICLTFIGMVFIDYVRALLSIGMILIFLLSILGIKKDTAIQKLKHRKDLLFFCGAFLCMLPSGLYSSNLSYFWERITIYLPFLLLPIAFIFLKPISSRQYMFLLYFFLLLVCSVAIQAFYNYLMHPSEINELYLHSKVMPTITLNDSDEHVSFSLMLALAISISYYLFRHQFYSFHSYERYLIIFMGVFLFMFIHLFSVRGGIIVLYCMIMVEMYRMMFIRKQYRNALIVFSFCISAGIIAWMYVPTIQNKLKNTKADLDAINHHKSANNLSLSSRKVSYEMAKDFIVESPILGCGLGNMHDRCEDYFAKNHPDISKRIMPHNQYLFNMAAIGIPLTLIWIFCLFYPLFYRKNYKHSILFVQYLLVFLACMFEAYFQTQLGVAFSLLFLLLPLNQVSNWHKTST